MKNTMNKIGWPEGNYLVSDKYQIAFCAIGKVAGTSIRSWMLGLCDYETEHINDKNAFAESMKIGLRQHDESKAREILKSYYKFVFVRNPYSRIVSTYLNKFVDKYPEPQFGAEALIREVESMRKGAVGSWSWIMSTVSGSHRTGVTFREFLRHIVDKPESSYDNHWKTQSQFVNNQQFDFIGHFESLSDDLQRLEQALNDRSGVPKIKIDIGKKNMSKYAKRVSTDANYMDMPPASLLELKQKSGYPLYQAFYDAETQDLLCRIYKDDFDQFGYSTDLAE